MGYAPTGPLPRCVDDVGEASDREQAITLARREILPDVHLRRAATNASCTPTAAP